MKFPNLLWVIHDRRMTQYLAAAMLGIAESRFSRCLSGRTDFSLDERKRLATWFGYPAGWLFQEVSPPTRAESCEVIQEAAV
jgi:hypothetical protein